MRNELKKICTKCGEEKPLSEFAKQLERRRSHCRVCTIAANKEYRLINKGCMNEQQRKKREANRFEYRAGCKRRYEANPEKFREKATEYRKAHPETKERVAVIAAKYRENLSAPYINQTLMSRGFIGEQITPDLIAAQRVRIKIIRAIKEKEMK